MQCKICKKELTKITKSQTCSRSCNAIYQNKIKAQRFKPNKCKYCGKNCRRVSRAVFCSSKCQSLYYSGERCPWWKGGRSINYAGGYIGVLNHQHPDSDKTGYVLEHRLIVEDYLRNIHPRSKWLEKRNDNYYLKRTIILHHINGNKKDNRLSNLYVCESQSEHQDIENGRKHIKMSNILDARACY